MCLFSDVATIIYRWTKQGLPQGVPFLHSNLTAAIQDTIEAIGSKCFTIGDRHLCYYPLAYSVEKIVLWAAMQAGMSIGFCDKHNQSIYDDIKALRPTFILGSPKVYELPFNYMQNSSKSWSLLYRVSYYAALRYKTAYFKR